MFRPVRIILLMVFLWIVYGLSVAWQSPASARSIIINLPSRTLELYEDGKRIKEYPVAIGKPSTPSPLGEYYVINKEINPDWYPPRTGKVIPSGPDNPLGYRWIGFLPMYGVHGTNEPWAIGGVVSNGCIRMHEADVEELYELISEGTPVKLTYDRIRIRLNEKNEVSIGVYPDIYGWQSISGRELRNQLNAYGLSGFAEAGMLDAIIAEAPERQIPFARLVTLNVNDKVLPDKVILKEKEWYVPVWALAGALNKNIAWDGAEKITDGKQRTVAGVVKGDILYVTLEGARILFGAQTVWLEEENTLAFYTLRVLVNRKLVAQDVQTVNGILAVPLFSLIPSFSQTAEWKPSSGYAMVGGRSIPVEVIGDQPYVPITKIYEYFKAYVYWDEKERTIEVTYPFNGD